MKKRIYTAPAVEVLEARVEKGFAGSGIDVNERLLPSGIDNTEDFQNGHARYN